MHISEGGCVATCNDHNDLFHYAIPTFQCCFILFGVVFMPKYVCRKVALGLTVGICTGFSSAGFAGDLSFGDAASELGQIDVSGWLRAKYQDKDYSDNDRELKFDAAKITIKYDAKHLFGELEYRCYQSDTLCDLSTLVNANLGYKVNAQDRVTVGLQNMPFGVGRSWGSSWYGSSLDNAGLEDVHNLGINYQHQFSDRTHLDLAYFIRDGGHYAGSGGDSARYSANFVHSEDTDAPTLKEKNMWLARIKQDIALAAVPDLKLGVGGSYWYSDLDNKDNGQTGHRNAWAAFAQLGYQNASATFTAGQNRVDNASLITPDYSTVGSFDSVYNVANKANFYVADLNYQFKNIIEGYHLTPYVTYAVYDKDKRGFATSRRQIWGAQLDVKQLSFAAEYIIGKNDVFIGGDENSLVNGDDNGRSRLLHLLLIYNF